ncbi:hypothetical protein D1AOALGA4SA_1012, partial [Olavius algarvensis Delta 1 endosymbiont]
FFHSPSLLKGALTVITVPFSGRDLMETSPWISLARSR